MAAYRLRTTGAYPLTESDIRAIHPNTSYPAILTAEHYDALGVDVVFPVPQPTNTDPIKTVREADPAQTSAGHWEQQWAIVPIYPDSDPDKAAKDAALVAAANATAIAQLQLACAAAVQNLIDTTAQSRRYDNALSCATYATSTNTGYKAEALAFVAWRDAVWASVYATQAAVEAGTQTPPTVEQLLAGLPPMVWPT